ncbi:hypothetical protein H4217_008759 [Coemansia sp. RSA 1939]|nr:hypothetical protein H4217_008759 [Coemansia sp. RSA 1939]KAJ2591278.1 hypothetical protein EV177_008907 [Coemansia sp. RSA 1804]KAJ2692854.1 hypothetical protein GGH99_001468 [Coemansia sp. RSA 1285]
MEVGSQAVQEGVDLVSAEAAVVKVKREETGSRPANDDALEDAEELFREAVEACCQAGVLVAVLAAALAAALAAVELDACDGPLHAGHSRDYALHVVLVDVRQLR